MKMSAHTSWSAVDAVPTDLLTVTDLISNDLESLISQALEMKKAPENWSNALTGKSAVLLFEKPSLRTRVSFEIGMAKLGGHAMYLDHNSVKIGERETIEDYGANLSQWSDVIVARTFSHDTVTKLADAATVPVINALTDLYHPCQALADYMTMLEIFGSLDGLKLAYVGDGNNVCHSLLLAGAMLGVSVTAICPPGHTPDGAVVQQAHMLAAQHGVTNLVTSDLDAIEGHDVVYTDKWVSMGDGMTIDEVAATFSPYKITPEIMNTASHGALFMHCLPAARGHEVDAAVIDGANSIVLVQACNRMHAQNALLHALLTTPAAASITTHRGVMPKATVA